MRERGFTLVEMMVALLIFAMIAAAGVTLLSVGVRTQEAAAARLDEVGDTRRMSALLANDFAQLVPRVSRDATGTNLPAFIGNTGEQRGTRLMSYVRGGWSNPAGAPRAAIQRVELVLAGNRLERRTFAAVDGSDVTTPVVLAERVSALAVRYRDAKGVWRARWDDPLPNSLPAAVEITVTQRGEAPVTMAFLAGVGA